MRATRVLFWATAIALGLAGCGSDSGEGSALGAVTGDDVGPNGGIGPGDDTGEDEEKDAADASEPDGGNGPPPGTIFCGNETIPLLAFGVGQIGTITLRHDTATFWVTLALEGGWTMTSSHVAVASDVGGLPVSGGSALLAFFPYQRTYGSLELGDDYGIPLGDLGVYTEGPECLGLTFDVTVHALAVVPGCDPAEIDDCAVTAAWIEGMTLGTADGSRFAQYAFTCCDAVPPDGDHGCTRSKGYWRHHRPEWSLDGELCGSPWDEVLGQSPHGDAWIILARQWIAATLNVAAGASTTPEVDDALSDGEALLAACVIDDDDRAGALDLAEILDDYNNGRIGPGPCDDPDDDDHCDDDPGDDDHGDDDPGDDDDDHGHHDDDDDDDDDHGHHDDDDDDVDDHGHHDDDDDDDDDHGHRDDDDDDDDDRCHRDDDDDDDDDHGHRDDDDDDDDHGHRDDDDDDDHGHRDDDDDDEDDDGHRDDDDDDDHGHRDDDDHGHRGHHGHRDDDDDD